MTICFITSNKHKITKMPSSYTTVISVPLKIFYLKFSLNLPDKGWTDPLLELVSWSVQVQDLDNLGDLQFVTHVTDTRYILLTLPGL